MGRSSDAWEDRAFQASLLDASEPGALATWSHSSITKSRLNPVATAPGSDVNGIVRLYGNVQLGKFAMAIGWGKSYEEQMEDANQRASKAERTPRLPLEDRLRLKQLESLKLSRSRILAQLERASVPAHREMLMKALQAIEKEEDETVHRGDDEHTGSPQD